MVKVMVRLKVSFKRKMRIKYSVYVKTRFKN